MAGNTFGTLFKLTTFGESHGAAIGGIIDGCPPNVEIDIASIQAQLDRRKPGQSKITTPRKEADTVQILSGIFEGKTTGTPIGFIIQNEDAKSKDYSHIKDVYRPSHADYTYDAKYGNRDYRGGGRSSARETASRVVGGAIAAQVLRALGVEVRAYVSQVGNIKITSITRVPTLEEVEANIVRCPEQASAAQMQALIEAIKKEGDTIGGVITCVAKNVPAGWGEPVFDKLHADLAKAMMSINAVKGFEIGSGFDAASMRGSEHNDLFNQNKTTKTNHSGGIQGGISNGNLIECRVAFKPVATLIQAQQTINKQGENVEMQGKGRHDPCVVPRAVPIVESMMLLTLVDHYLRQQAIKNH